MNVGKDATDEFEDAGHSKTPRELMETFCVGELDTSNIPRLEVVSEEHRNYIPEKLLDMSKQYWAAPVAAVGLSRLPKRRPASPPPCGCAPARLTSFGKWKSPLCSRFSLLDAGPSVGKGMEKVDKGEVPEAVKDAMFIKLPLFSFAQLFRGDVKQKLEDLRNLVKGFVQRGVILYIGDLKWIVEFRTTSLSHGRGYHY
ncbi:hypothetical protein E3N88_37552 [Mikania micrantha]|uniref:Uncharacterized protein n=1 Tax=Mikania micrantha TaxID=192012 RepID=A0A5N6LSF3_9ASTR|nr:hypothetical protein E3N88_37552 [Mikania micrantha]